MGGCARRCWAASPARSSAGPGFPCCWPIDGFQPGTPCGKPRRSEEKDMKLIERPTDGLWDRSGQVSTSAYRHIRARLWATGLRDFAEQCDVLAVSVRATPSV